MSNITEEDIRSNYPQISSHVNVSLKGSAKATSPEKRQVAKSPVRAMAPTPKTPQGIKSQVAVKTPQNVKIPQQVAPKTPTMVTRGNTPVVQKTLPVVKTPIVTAKSPGVGSKTAIVKPPLKSPQIGKASPKITMPAKAAAALAMVQAAKTQVASPKTPAAVKTNSPQVKATQQRHMTPGKPQVVPKQQTPGASLLKMPVKTKTAATAAAAAAAASVSKEDSPDQSTLTVVYNMPPANQQRPANQLTIEKVVDQKQRVVGAAPVVLDSSNHVILRQVISGTPQLVSVPPAVQSVVIGTTARPASVTTTAPPQVEITTSEPLQALQVTQQVTLFRPEGSTFNIEDVKKQIPLNKQSAMTNVVSSTTNSIPAAAAVQSQPEQKVVLPAAKVAQSPVRQSAQRGPQKPVNQYQGIRKQMKKVSPKREIQKVPPLQPPPIPPPELHEYGNEEEVTTSEEMTPPLVESESGTKLIVILPTGEEKRLTITNNFPLTYTLQDLLKSVNVSLPDNSIMTAEITDRTVDETYPEMEGSEAQWEDCETANAEPGEILGLHHGDLEPGQLDSECPEPEMLPPIEDTLKEPDSVSSRKTKADSLIFESPKKKKICRRRKADEPVCLTISDDEELLGLHRAHPPEEIFHSDSNSQMSSCDKEPIITDDMMAELKHSSVSGGGKELEELLDNPNEEDTTYLQCRTVRIGSYKVIPKDLVVITPHGLKVTVPVVNSSDHVELKILNHEIIRVLIHFGRSMPVLFFYTKPAAAAKIRKALHMTDRSGVYYDSMSDDETHKRITFLPAKLDEDCKQKLKNIFGGPENHVLAELSGKEANDILVKASPKEVQAFIMKKTPNQQPPQPQPFNGQDIQTIMVYPPPPEKGGIPINTEDYACLGEDQFLNDVIIDFYLKYVVEKTLSPEDRARTHVFSSFFYKRLTTKPPPKRKLMNPIESDPSATPAQKRHSRVKSWTKNVDLFTKDFIVIPINENSHWFLAIVCFPGLTGPVRFSDNTPLAFQGRKKKTDDNPAAVGVLSGKHTVTIGSTTITAVAPALGLALDDEGEDRDEADGEDENMDVPDEEEPVLNPTPEVKEEEPEEDKMTTRSKQREPIKQPCILIFDSLAGASRSRVVATLRDYLRVEYETKHSTPRDFSGEVMKGTNVRCPQQTNYTDCGLYVLQYVEAFFQWPVTDYHIPIKQLQDWFKTDIVNRKRYEIQQLLHRLMQEQNIDVDAMNLPLLNLRPEGTGGHLVEYSGSDEEEEEDEEDEAMLGEEEEDLMDEEEFNDELEHENEDMEEGEFGHHEDEEDPDNFMDPHMEHEDQEMDEEYGLDEEDPQDEEDMEDKELEDISLTPVRALQRKDLKNYRIPRLINMTDKDRIG